MAISTKTTLVIDGENISRFSELSISQKVNSHHVFRVLLPIPREIVSDAIDTAQKLIGQQITIAIKASTMATHSDFEFNGIVTEANIVRTFGSGGHIVVKGCSPTILLDGAKKSQSFTENSLSEIVQTIAKNYNDSHAKPNVNIKKNEQLPYTVQYNESDFAFLTRMAAKKGEWFYYNGDQLYFGKPTQFKTLTLEYGKILHQFNIEMKTKPLAFEYLGYDASSADTQSASSKQASYQPQGYTKSVFDASNKLYPESGTTLYNNAIEESSASYHLANRIETELQGHSSDLVIAQGESDETGIRVGDVVVINESSFSSTGNARDGLKEQNYGGYIVTEIHHYADEIGTYYNNFVAVPEAATTPPYTNIHQSPKAHTQPAVVIDNNDPKGMGRIQVQMAWQKYENTQTPWLRMTNPHAGSGKGMYFIPENGEEVLVAFENDNAEKPYIQGTMYNGNETSSYASAGNDKKVIQTRSGTKIIMNDAIGSVFIEDPSGNTWMMDGKGNISVNAPNTISMNATDIIMTASKNISSNAGMNISESAGVDKNSSVGMMHNLFVGGNSMTNVIGSLFEIVKGNRESETKERKEIAKTIDVFSTEGEINMKSAKEVNKHAAEKSKIS